MASTLKSINLHCNVCNHATNHLIVQDKVERRTDIEWHGVIEVNLWSDDHVQVLKCGSCNEYSMKTYYIWCDDAPDYPERDVRIFPPRGVASIRSAESFTEIPENILELYREIVTSFINDANILCAGGIRAILEAICVHKRIKGGTVPAQGLFKESLQGKIFGLFEQGFITMKHAEILVHNQYLGDKALHELDKPTKEELQLAIEIIAHTLSSIYELDVKATELVSRKDKRKTPKP